MTSARPFYVAGEPAAGSGELVVRDKFRDAVHAAVQRPTSADRDRALATAFAARGAAASVPAFERERILRQLADGVAEGRAAFVATLIAEAGKPRKFAELEVARTLDTLLESARQAAAAGAGSYLPLDQTERGAGHRALWRRVPRGVVACITPFNFPLNLVAHKIGPAIAAGCPFVLKPASLTPLSALLLGDLLATTAWPAAAWSILPLPGADSEPLASDPRTAVLSFTGSADVGWRLRAATARAHVVLELGGNAAVIVHGDADLADAATRIAAAAFAQAGQSCISVQRIFVERPALEPFRAALLAATGRLSVGDPADPRTDVGPMIAEPEARRVESWIAEAVAGGARLLCGGRRDRALLSPTLLENARAADKVSCHEVFGPVATLTPYDTFDQALALANDSRFGLQAGLFTRDLLRAWRAYDALEVGGVIVNGPPAFRAENMPYGGVKESGLGREGVRFAIEDYTEIKTLVFRD
ncbi:MAG: aldehyde dehydrogenase family protein [Phycisphaerae bacterium]